MKRTAFALVVCAPLLTGCPTSINEPPPPPRKPEIAVAPPRALGALAAGTDAAPRPEVTMPGAEAEPDAPLVPPEAPAPEGSAPVPHKPPPAAAPDAGMAL